MDIEKLQAICKGYPQVTEDIKWGNDLCFCIGEKMFCVAGLGQQPTSASFKVNDAEFDEICQREGFSPAPYLARYKWVLVDNLNRMTGEQWEYYTRQSYELVAAKLPAKIKKQIGIQ